MRTKQSKTAKILKLLATGKSVKVVAEKVGTTPNYVYFVKWNAAKKTAAPAKKPVKKAAKKTAKNTNIRDVVSAMHDAGMDVKFDLVPSQQELPLTDTPNPLKVQVGGDHYKCMDIQPIQYIMANDLGFLEGCIIKRISRWRDKGGIEDLEKIKHEVDLLINAERELDQPSLRA